MIVAVALGIYGLLDFFVFSGEKQKGQDKDAAARSEKIAAFAASAGTELSSITKQADAPDTDYLISKAESNWQRDPFVVYTSDQNDQIVLDDTSATDKIPTLTYTGFIQAGKKVLAVVNGMEYAIGEMLTDVGYKVSGITPTRVVLLTELNKEIILQLEEN